MLPQPDHEVLASGHIRRQRSPLFGPLFLLVAVLAVVAGYQALAYGPQFVDQIFNMNLNSPGPDFVPWK